MKGTLYIVPVPAHPEAAKVIPSYVTDVVNTATVFVVESLREARRNLRKMGCTADFDSLAMHELDKHNQGNDNVDDWLQPIKDGATGALISDAGCPAVADPGATVVAAAHRLGIKVIPLVGPSSLLLALMGSGLNGQSFAFHGYLPVKSGDRLQRIRELEKTSAHWNQTQMFIETPYRSDAMMQDLLKGLSPETMLSVATNLTGPNERITTQSVGEWNRKNMKLDKMPAVFLFLRSRV